MNAEQQERLNGWTAEVLAASACVSNTLGAGFLEKVYENALAVEFRARKVRFSQQAELLVRYRDEIVGQYFPDFLVEGSVIVEVKALPTLTSIHHAQCLNYLRASGIHVGLLLNFGAPRVQVRRLVHGF